MRDVSNFSTIGGSKCFLEIIKIMFMARFKLVSPEISIHE